jgi:hypothetical protein
MEKFLLLTGWFFADVTLIFNEREGERRTGSHSKKDDPLEAPANHFLRFYIYRLL